VNLDLFNPIGIDEAKARFIEALLLTCLLKIAPGFRPDHRINNASVGGRHMGENQACKLDMAIRNSLAGWHRNS